MAQKPKIIRIPISGKNIAYLRVSTSDQDLDKFEADILRFANARKFGPVKFVKEKVSGKIHWKKRAIKEILESCDRLIVPELSRLGRSTLEVLEILEVAKSKEINVYSVKENLELDDSIQSKVMTTMLALFSELERDFISQRTKEALKARKAAGVKLGRPKGPGKSKLDVNRDGIIALLKTGVPKVRVARKYDVAVTTIYNWLNKNNIEI